MMTMSNKNRGKKGQTHGNHPRREEKGAHDMLSIASSSQEQHLLDHKSPYYNNEGCDVNNKI